MCFHFFTPGTRQFYTQLQQYPQDIIPIMDNVFNTVYTEMFGEIDGGRRIQVKLIVYCCFWSYGVYCLIDSRLFTPYVNLHLHRNHPVYSNIRCVRMEWRSRTACEDWTPRYVFFYFIVELDCIPFPDLIRICFDFVLFLFSLCLTNWLNLNMLTLQFNHLNYNRTSTSCCASKAWWRAARRSFRISKSHSSDATAAATDWRWVDGANGLLYCDLRYVDLDPWLITY